MEEGMSLLVPPPPHDDHWDSVEPGVSVDPWPLTEPRLPAPGPPSSSLPGSPPGSLVPAPIPVRWVPAPTVAKRRSLRVTTQLATENTPSSTACARPLRPRGSLAHSLPRRFAHVPMPSCRRPLRSRGRACSEVRMPTRRPAAAFRVAEACDQGDGGDSAPGHGQPRCSRPFRPLSRLSNPTTHRWLALRPEPNAPDSRGAGGATAPATGQAGVSAAEMEKPDPQPCWDPPQAAWAAGRGLSPGWQGASIRPSLFSPPGCISGDPGRPSDGPWHSQGSGTCLEAREVAGAGQALSPPSDQEF